MEEVPPRPQMYLVHLGCEPEEDARLRRASTKMAVVRAILLVSKRARGAIAQGVASRASVVAHIVDKAVEEGFFDPTSKSTSRSHCEERKYTRPSNCDWGRRFIRCKPVA